MKLLKEVIQYLTADGSIKCPYCGTNLQFEKINFGRESINIICAKCGIFEHYDGTLQKRNK